MLRFQPDSWLEGLLRPLILADPVGYVYFELPAPDLRFALLALLVPLALAWRRMRARLPADAWRTVIALVVMLYLWTFTTGNGRYFMAGLLLAGPLVVALIARLPFTRGMCVVLLAVAVTLQVIVVHAHYAPGQWAMAFWTRGHGQLLVKPSSTPPAVFITVHYQTYSILVPQFHPESRWINLVGQSSIRPGSLHHRQFKETLQSGLPIYLILPAAPAALPRDLGPGAEVDRLLKNSLSPHALVARSADCELLVSHMTMRAPSGMEFANAPRLAFWQCPVVRDLQASAGEVPVPRWNDVFNQVEQSCPKYFPPGRSEQRTMSEVEMRDYPSTDTRLYVDGSGQVVFQHRRAISPTSVGNAEKIRQGDFSIDCDKLPGRYVYPWRRG